MLIYLNKYCSKKIVRQPTVYSIAHMTPCVRYIYNTDIHNCISLKLIRDLDYFSIQKFRLFWTAVPHFLQICRICELKHM